MSESLTFPIALGDEVRDKVTGYTGVVTSLTEWYNRCQRAGIQGPLKADGSIPMTESFDVEQLEIVQAGKVSRSKATSTGGPMPDPQRERPVRER